MHGEKIIESLSKKFPQLPPARHWEKHNMNRYYFNKEENGTDYTFFIDFTDKNNPKLRQKHNTQWYSKFPEKQVIRDFLYEKEARHFTINSGVSSEFYQVNPEKLGTLYCYKLNVIGNEVKQVGGKLSYQLLRKFNAVWNFSGKIMISNYCAEESSLAEFLRELWSTESETYKNLTKIQPLKNKMPSPEAVGAFAANLLKIRYKKDINSILTKYKKVLGRIKIDKQCVIRGGAVNNLPAISISIKSHIYDNDTFDKFLNILEDKKDIINFPVIDVELEHVGKINGIVGELKDHRDRLLSVATRENIKQKILKAPDDELVLIVDGEYHYPASTLHPLVTTKNAPLFKVYSSKLMISLTLSPELRNKIEAELILLFKDYIVQNFNSDSFPELFKMGEEIGFSPILKFGDGSFQPEDEFVLVNLKKHGIYKLNPKFKDNKTIKITLLLGTLFRNHEGFWDSLEKELAKLGIIPRLKNKVTIEEFNPIAIENKVKPISKDPSDIILALLPEKSNKDSVYELVKSILFNLNIIKSQFIFEETIRNKLQWAFANVILGILAKTESIPYILASPLIFADYFVGIDISREQKKTLKGSQNYAATARFYGKDGTFSHYEIQEDKIEGETLPTEILERIFAKSMFQGKTIMIHRDGYFRGNEIPYLKKLGKKHGIKFQFVEVIKRNVPRLYRVQNDNYLNPQKNQIFYISEKEAIIINNEVKGAKTANPLRIRVCDNETKLDNAIVSVMALRMMHFGTTKAPKLPVTISFSDRISGFVRRGIKPPNKSGKIPWWY